MNTKDDLEKIPRRDRWLQTVGYSPATSQSCYLVLSNRYFGWYPCQRVVYLPFFFPEEYYTIPLSSVERVEFRHTPTNSIRIHTRAPESETSVLEMQVPYPHLFVRAFRDLGIPLIGAEL